MRPPRAIRPRPAGPSISGLRQFALFAAIGVVNTGVYYAVYTVLNIWLPYLAAHAGGYAVGVTGSFLLNSAITLRTRPTWRGFVRYPLSGVVSLVCSGALLHLAVTRLRMDEHLAAIAAGALVTPLSFLLARWAITSGARDPVTEGASSR
ncbi:GtrA family protein [Streptomyces sp. NPDC007861]|uniref:GtrA family protein n=1 Tax=Streptomyces sp. NPDC007861 TaxID=3154893 RepID=UPI0033BFD3A5